MESIYRYSLEKRYLAYIAMLAGWLIFCYWLYAKEIYPRFHDQQGTPWPVIVEDQELPLAFRWGSDLPYAGKDFENWAQQLETEDSLRKILVLKASYFRDETSSIEKGKKLAYRRAQRMIRYFELDSSRTMIEILPIEITSDARSAPIEAFRYEAYVEEDLMAENWDTLEVCFPVRDSFKLPGVIIDKLDAWMKTQTAKQESMVHIVGTADGTGITESSDVAFERAEVVKEQLLKNGWSEENMQVSTGQRVLPRAIRNKCVLIYFE